MSEATDDRCECLSARSENSGVANGTRAQVTSTRSLVDNAVFRHKTIIGRSMRSRIFDGQRVEVQLVSKTLNTMTCLGMPDSYRVA